MEDVLTSVDIPENVEMGGELVEIYEDALHDEKFITPLFQKRKFHLRKRYKIEGEELLQELV